MKLLSTQYLSSLAQLCQKLVIGLMMVMPLIAVSPATSAAEQDSINFSQAELDQMLAPIALYPDTLLSQVLIASTYPLEVIQADRWVRSNKDLSTEDSLKFAENKDWDPSVKSLVAFPDILKRMSEDVDWTQKLGDAFLSDEGDVMDAVQRLRKRAYATGNLEKAQHISVERDDNYITIEPAEERVVYVPVYDTRVVYGNWWWPEYPPIYWNYPNYTYTSGFYWGSSVFVGSTYFYSSPRWRDRRVVVIDRHNHYNTNFYTGRSIVRYEGARNWSHNPEHRLGVAYYNNRLRDTYKSPRPSLQSDREYRNVYRDRSRDGNYHQDDNRNDNRTTGNIHYNSRNPVNNNDARPFDRSEQVRERLNRTNNNGMNNNVNNGGVNTGVITGTNNRENRPWQNNNSNRDINRTNQRESGTTISPNRDIRRDDATDRSRAAMQTGVNTPVQPNRINQERPAISEDNRRAVFSGNTTRTAEQRAPDVGPQQRVERSQNPTFTPPRNESRGEQRTERGNHNSRFTRDKKDDDSK